MTKLYVDHMSQPSRACLLFVRVNFLDVEEVLLKIGKGDTRSPSYLAKNPLGKVPFLEEADGYGLPESASILRYLCATRSVPEYWYPPEPKKRARVDAAMDWHAGNLRIGSMIVVWNRVISKNLGQPGNEQLVLDYGLPTLKQALQVIENVWLSGCSYVGGTDEISIADLLLCCEIEQLCLLNAAATGPTMEELLSPYRKIQAWLDRVRDRCAPHYNDVHIMLRRLSTGVSSRSKI